MDQPKLDRRQLLTIGGAGALSALALTGAPAIARADNADAADEGRGGVLGAWSVTVHVDGSSKPFDTLYTFAAGGAFARVDGRNNAPALGTWAHAADGSVNVTFVLYSFNTSGQRVGTITAYASSRVHGETLSGTFRAVGVDTSGNPLPGFPKTGTFDGTRIVAQAP